MSVPRSGSGPYGDDVSVGSVVTPGPPAPD